MNAPSTPLFQVENLHARPTTDDLDSTVAPEILKGLDLVVNQGEVHAIMGPNGCGKSTLASCLLASPEYEVTATRWVWPPKLAIARSSVPVAASGTVPVLVMPRPDV